jgi:hypothetical protein
MKTALDELRQARRPFNDVSKCKVRHQTNTIVSYLCLLFVLAPQPLLAENIPEFGVHFVNALPDANAGQFDKAAAEREVEILNQYFKSADGNLVVHFHFAGYERFSAPAPANCTAMNLLKTLDVHSSAWKKQWFHDYRICKEPRFYSKSHVNFIVADNIDARNGAADVDSMGGMTGNVPFVIIDPARLGHKIQSPEEHEMGHAFGLAHVCHPGAKTKTPTNIMGSKANWKGSGGARTVGITPLNNFRPGGLL